MRACVASVPVLFLLFAADACNKENVGTVEGPPLKAASATATAAATPIVLPAPSGAPGASPSPSAGPSIRAPSNNPVSASFVDVTAKGTDLKLVACEQLTIVLVRGKASAFGAELAAGDVLVARAAGTSSLKGEGLAVVATVQPPQCEPGGVTKLLKKVPASAAPELTWAGGKMHAHLDVGAEVSPNAYTGRLEGSAPVAEHVHPDSWEILCAVDAKGTFVLDGKEQRLGPKQVVVVPPNTKHQWKPDEGSKLVGIQFYAPPGPEQRFKKLAEDELAKGDATERDAGKR
jgi:mannose-6-phosphate isomerase-like protein (cupin superfamily)